MILLEKIVGSAVRNALKNFIDPFAIHVPAHLPTARVVFQNRFLSVVNVIGPHAIENAFHAAAQGIICEIVSVRAIAGPREMLIVDVGVTNVLVVTDLVLGTVADRASGHRGVLVESVGGVGCVPVRSIAN